jgi:hypothetical protein
MGVPKGFIDVNGGVEESKVGARLLWVCEVHEHCSSNAGVKR